MMTEEQWQALKFFKKTEFDCKCGCGRNDMQPDFMRKLDDARSRVDYPWIITSGYRCPDYNEQISSTGKTGPHTTGRAADVAVFGSKAFWLVMHMSLGGWMTGIGLKQHGPHTSRFIHVDDLPRESKRFRPTIWTYS